MNLHRDFLAMKWLCLAGLLLLAACGGSTPKIERLPHDAVILAFGDSLTFGTGAPTNESYPEQLARLTGRKVVAAGVPGEVSALGLARLNGVLDEVQPRLLILCHGGNDLLRKLDETQAANNLRAMIRMAKARGIAVVLIGVPRPGIFLSTADFYQGIAEADGLPYDAEILKTILSDNALKADVVHPNARGYARLAEAVARLLREAGAI
jgi:lysophospholipase L1-like esterase